MLQVQYEIIFDLITFSTSFSLLPEVRKELAKIKITLRGQKQASPIIHAYFMSWKLFPSIFTNFNMRGICLYTF